MYRNRPNVDFILRLYVRDVCICMQYSMHVCIRERMYICRCNTTCILTQNEYLFTHKVSIVRFFVECVVKNITHLFVQKCVLLAKIYLSIGAVYRVIKYGRPLLTAGCQRLFKVGGSASRGIISNQFFYTGLNSCKAVRTLVSRYLILPEKTA